MLGMYIIECLPLIKASLPGPLSYFSTKAFEPGSLIKVELRKKQVAALVLSNKSVAENKAEIKSADFTIKKISAFGSGPFLRKEFLAGVDAVAEYFATSTGSVLHQLIPSLILKDPKMLPLIKPPYKSSPPDKLRYEVEALQADSEERTAHYKSIIRESFAKKKSVFLCLSQNENIRDLEEKLSRGIEHFVCVFHNLQTPKELKEVWQKILTSEHPILIIATAHWLFLPRIDLGTIIIEGESKSGWKTLSRPFIDLRMCVEILGRSMGARIILGDTFLRTETLWRYKEQQIGGENIKWRLSNQAPSRLIDLESIIKKDKAWQLLSKDFLEEIGKTTSEGGNVFIYSSRKGLSPTTVCRDCGTRVSCNNCDSPMILYKTKNGNVFRCHQCGEVRGAEELCRYCNSWNLIPLGAGVDKLADEIRKSFPSLESTGMVFELHKDVASSHARASKIAEKFFASRGAILVGTELAIAYLHKKVATTAIASIDSLFAVPDFRIREKIFKLILEMTNLAKEKFVIQSRKQNDPAIELGLAGNLMDFYRLEIADREALLYPPFSVFIKVTVRGTKSFVSKEVETLRTALLPWQAVIFASIHEKKGEQAAVNAVIKIKSAEYPSPSLTHTLRSLPLHFEIKIAPDNLL